jgi:hypothetical protein
MNGTHQLLVCADDVNTLDVNKNIMKKIRETLLQFSRTVGPDVNAEKTKYMAVFRHQNGGQNYNLLITNKPLSTW